MGAGLECRHVGPGNLFALGGLDRFPECLQRKPALTPQRGAQGQHGPVAARHAIVDLDQIEGDDLGLCLDRKQVSGDIGPVFRRHRRQPGGRLGLSFLRHQDQHVRAGDARVANGRRVQDDLADRVSGHHRDRIVVSLCRIEPRQDRASPQQVPRGADLAARRTGDHDFEAPVQAGRVVWFQQHLFVRRSLLFSGSLLANSARVLCAVILFQHACGPSAVLEALHHGAFGKSVVRAKVGRAQFPDVDEAKTVVLERPGDQGVEVCVKDGAPGDKPCAADVDRGAQVERPFDVSDFRGRGDRVVWGEDRMFAAGHAEIEIVGDQDRDTDVAPRRIDEVVAADAASAVADQHHDVQVGVCQLDPRGIGDRAPVQAVKGIGVKVAV